MSFTPVATTDTLETFRTRYNATNITLVDDSSSTVDITLATDSLKISGGTGTASVISGDTLTLNLSNTGVSAASYGSATAIPVLAVNAQGQITSASTASISTDLTLVDDASTTVDISLATDSLKISGGTGTTSAISGDTLTINLDNTAVSAGSFGSATAIPVLTVDAQGRITAASTASVSTDLTIADTSSTTEAITLGSETLKFDGGTGVSASISSGTVTYNFDGTSFTTFKYTATSGQTSFSGADGNGVTLAYSAGKRNVFLNGVLLDESDFTASNGTSVVLGSGAAANDILTVIAFAVNNIAVLDANGSEFVLDADGDTSITADTDDQIDFKIAGADDFRMIANNFKVLSGSTLTIDSGATITNSGTANGFGGTVVQVEADEVTAEVTGSGTYSDLGLSVSITPTSGSNHILLVCTGSIGLNTSAAFKFIECSTAVGIGDTPGSNTNRVRASFKVKANDLNSSENFAASCIINSPGTSAVTYKVQVEADSDGTWALNRSFNLSNSDDSIHSVTSSYLYAIELDADTTDIDT